MVYQHDPHRLRGLLKRKVLLKGRFPTGDIKSRAIDLNFFRGDTVRLVIEVVDQDDRVVDLTDTNIKLTIREDEFSVLELYSLDSEQGSSITILDAPKGIVQIELSPEFTSTLKARDYPFDVQLQFKDGFIGTVVKDWLSFTRDMTV